jgi:hypothetical protein
LGDIAELDPMDEPGMSHGRLGRDPRRDYQAGKFHVAAG